jgi:hypothetical protein
MCRGVEVRVLLAFFTLSFLALPVARADAAATPPSVTHVGGTIRGNEARVRFRLENAFSPEMVEALKSGIEISFRIRVEVERVHSNWFDVTVGEVKDTHSIRYDVLSRVYNLRHGGGVEVLPDIREALQRMSRFEVTVPVTGDVARGKAYRAGVRVRLDRAGLSDPLRSIVFFSSVWDVETKWAYGPVQAP